MMRQFFGFLIFFVFGGVCLAEPTVSEPWFLITHLRSNPDVESQEHLLATRWRSAQGRLKPAIAGHRPIVAVIDTGTEITHPYIKPNIWVNKKEVPNNDVDDDGNGYVDDVHGFDFMMSSGDVNPKLNDHFFYHGTHVAGLIKSIHPRAIIMPLNVFGDRYSTNVEKLEKAIRYAVDNGATIINMSIGGNEYSSTMLETLRYATSKGAFIAAAAGNDASEISPSSESARYKTPAIFGRKVSGMLTVTSVDIRGSRLSSFANFGMFFVEFAAPGAVVSTTNQPIGLLSSIPGNGYGRMAGTSMATPLVSGAAAIVQSFMKAEGKTVSPSHVESTILSGSRQNDNLLALTRNAKVLDFQILMDKLEGRTSPVIDGVRPSGMR